jgi:ABC-type glycerol-3-phosphate transport system substrate-binding protein
MNIRPFEIILIAIFAGAALAGLIYLSTMKGGTNPEDRPYGERVSVWGTFDQSAVDTVINNQVSTDSSFSVVKYRRIDERSFESELLNAIADGNPPDLILLPHDLLVSFRSKLTVIPFETIPERTFRDTYIDGAQIFMRSNGTYAIPFAVDPLVLFWNRDLFSNEGLAEPPKTWESLVNETTPRLTVSDSRRVITQSAIGMGEFINVKNAKEILSMLFFQSGTTIAEELEDSYIITLQTSQKNSGSPAPAALNFYTQFVSPASSAYTWSRSQQFDRNAFTAGKLGMYFGKGTEIRDIEDENPNLSFDIAPVPQAQGATALRNYGTFYGFAIPKTSRNVSGAYLAAMKLTESAIVRELTTSLGLTPAHRALYSGTPTSVYDEVLRESALIARGWLDPAPKETSTIFKTMVESITSGRSDADGAVNDALYSLEVLYR